MRTKRLRFLHGILQGGHAKKGQDLSRQNGWGGAWKPTASESWAKAFGLATSRLFGPKAAPTPGEYSVLLDGRAATFALLVSNDASLLVQPTPLEWAWSSHLRHVASIHPASETLILRTWDNPSANRRFAMPQTRDAAAGIISLIEKARPLRAEDAVSYLLWAFRSTREIVPEDSLLAVRLFNTMLFAAGLANEKKIERESLRSSRTVGDLLNVLSADHESELETILGDAITNNGIRQRQLYAALHRFIEPEPRFNYSLDPWLLLRHASGDLYQEAHLVLEQSSQSRLAGFVSLAPPAGKPRMGVRFTPPTLARALAEQAIAGADLTSAALTILDPACGSGVFLIEAVRELIRRGYKGTVTLHGIDISPISCAMADFALRFAVDEAKAAGLEDARKIVTTANSLTCDWTAADIILMNPPFIPWTQLDNGLKDLVRSEMGEAAKGRTDLAMAFILRAAKSVRPKGMISAVLPSPLLDSVHGAGWREELSTLADVRLLGRFEGYSYFRASTVEPAFVVLEKKSATIPSEGPQILLAKAGAEEKALRSLRAPEVPPSNDDEWSLYTASPELVEQGKWMPRWPATTQIQLELLEKHTPRVSDLFEVRQGALTGHNETFLLSRKHLEELPKDEQKFFKPAAGTKTISEGRIEETHYVFYPYDASGVLLKSEEDLERAVPVYLRQYLLPNKVELETRQLVNQKLWWTLTRAREEWQAIHLPKLVTSYFGRQGGFAFDELGRFVVVHGYAWLWKQRPRHEEIEGDAIEVAGRMDEHLAFAYLAVLNSGIFEQLLALSCPRMAGSQFNLSKRFVSPVFIPDLTDEFTPAHTLTELERAGRTIHEGREVDLQKLDHSVAAAYRISVDAVLAARL